MNSTQTCWDASQALLVTRLQGAVQATAVEQWADTLQRTLAHLADNTSFKLIVDLYGYEPQTLSAHQAMRTVIPLTLARYGFRTALLDLFEGADLPVTQERGIQCTAVAHVHHEVDKMTEYEHRFGCAAEHFFTDYQQAEAWIHTRPR